MKVLSQRIVVKGEIFVDFIKLFAELFLRITTKLAYKFHCNVECLKIFVVKILRIECKNLEMLTP